MRAFITAFVTIAAFSEWHSPATLLGQQRPPVIDMHLHADLPPYDVPPGTPALCRPEPLAQSDAAGPCSGPPADDV